MNDLPNPRQLARDPEAFEAFYRAHVGEVQRFIARRVDDPQVAADLTADVFVAVIERASTYRQERGSTLAWVFGIARNVVSERGRTRARQLKLASRIRGRALLDEDALLRIEERLDAESDARRVFAAMTDIPDADRELLELVALDGLEPDDVAAHLNIEPGTARVRLHRARRRLTAAMAADQLIP